MVREAFLVAKHFIVTISAEISQLKVPERVIRLPEEASSVPIAAPIRFADRMAKTMYSIQDNPANALSINKEATHVVIAGRNVFKILVIEEDRFGEGMNLRVGKNINLNYSCSDVIWHPLDDSILATAATNGAVVIWDLNKSTRSKQDIVFQQHKRTVNKVTFHPTESNILLSGSQDGTVKHFDLRTKKDVTTFNSNSESVRDVQFSPHQPYTFVSVQENGNISLWDLRTGDKCERQFTGHSGPVFACDWHPDDKKWLATAGRDKTIKVWDVSTKTQLDFTVATIASVARIKWRPQRKYHIANSSLVVDFSVNVWDLRRPFIPFAAFTEHKDAVTGISWRHSPHVFLSTGKDNKLYQHAFKDAERPADRANPMGLDINCAGHIAMACSNKIFEDSTVVKQNSSKTIPAFFRRALTLGEMFPQSLSSCMIFEDPSEKILSLKWVVESAKRYLLTGKSFEELCDHNAAVATDLDRPTEANTWNFLKILYSTSSTIPPASELPTKNNVSEVLGPDADKDKAPGPSLTVVVKGSDTQSIDLEEQNPCGAQRALRHHSGNNRHPPNGSETSTGLTDEDTETDDTDQGETMANIAYGLAASTQKQFWEGQIGYDPLLFCNWDDPPEEDDDDSEMWTLPREAFTPRHELTMTHTPPPEQLCLTTFSPRKLANTSEDLAVPTEIDDHVPITIKPEALVVPPWDCTLVVQNMLNHYAMQGDIQMSVVALLILGKRLKDGVIDKIVQEQWYNSYIDLLARFQLWSEVNEVTQLCPLRNISTVNQNSTNMHTNCGKCSRQLQYNSWHCDRCKITTSICSICRRIVKGVYVWCQGCSHGGHLQHMKEWLEVNPFCPTGCGHLCEYA